MFLGQSVRVWACEGVWRVGVEETKGVGRDVEIGRLCQDRQTFM